MERLGIKRIDGEYPRVILYNNDKVSLEISFEGNLDLYFVLKGADVDNKVIINESNCCYKSNTRSNKVFLPESEQHLHPAENR